MYKYFNPNPYGKRANDCTIRAIAKATDQSWQDVYIQMFLKGFEMGDMPASNAVWSVYLMDRGFLRASLLFQEVVMAIYPQKQQEIIGYYGDSEFLNIIGNRKAEDVWAILDELMETLKVVNPRLYDSVIRKMAE